MNAPLIHSCFLTVATPYPVVLLDAWGVFWGGSHLGLFPGAKETMQALVNQNKRVVILSNSTQLAQKEVQKLAHYGVLEGSHFHFLITSGEVTRKLISSRLLPFPTPQKTYWLFGESHTRYSSHEAVFEGSVYRRTESIEKADFIYVTVPLIDQEDQTDPEVFRASLLKISALKKPMLCPNPDQFAHEGNPPRPVVRQGSIARLYEEMGGDVFYVGKPSSLMYEEALRVLSATGLYDLKDILMVGDTPETDIRGANKVGIASVLLTETGMMAEKIKKSSLQQAIENLELSDQPHHFVRQFSL